MFLAIEIDQNLFVQEVLYDISISNLIPRIETLIDNNTKRLMEDGNTNLTIDKRKDGDTCTVIYWSWTDKNGKRCMAVRKITIKEI